MGAFLNRIATATPKNDVHLSFIEFADRLLEVDLQKALFKRLVRRSQIEHRWSVLQIEQHDATTPVDGAGLYKRGGFASTEARMRIYEAGAIELAVSAVNRLELGDGARDITHVLVTSCTGFSAPGVDLQLVERCGLNPSVERTVIGFMGCYAAVNALKMARHIVRSEEGARVLVVSVELCTLHLQETSDLQDILSFLLFADGCGAALVSAEPTGLCLERFHAELAPEAADQITWRVGDHGFQMVLSGQVPTSVGAALRTGKTAILNGARVEDIDLWAVHPGGRSILDSVEGALELPSAALDASRDVLRNYGNMSSATILFVLDLVMRKAKAGQRGCAMAFGPGLSAETFLFTAVG